MAAMTSDANFQYVGRTKWLFQCLDMHRKNPLPDPEAEEIMACLVEALLGAVYLDGDNDLGIVEELMQRWGLSYAAGLARISGSSAV